MTVTLITGNIKRNLIEGIDYTIVDGTLKLTSSLHDELSMSALKEELNMSDCISITYEEPAKPAEIRKSVILGIKLSIEEQNYILGDLFGFSVDITGVIYDDEGDEFHGYSFNDVYDLTTLAGIFKYAQATSFKKGANDLRNDLNKLLKHQ